MYFNVIASGSKGNATIVIHKDTRILIDMGITLSRLQEGLAEVNTTIEQIDAAIFTHNHSDHIGGIKFLSPKIMFGLEGTLPSSLSNVCFINETFNIKDIAITPIRTSHDAKNPCGFLLVADEEKMLYMTDTGVFLEENLPLVKDPTYLIIESNHDIKMLLHTNRTFELKQRIMSDVGHLCNEDSAIATCSIIGPHTKEVVLAHLSEEANTPELAMEAYQKIFKHFHINIEKYNVRCANQRISLLGGNTNED